MIFKTKTIWLLLPVLLLMISSFASSDKDDNDFTKPEDLVNTKWDCNEPPEDFDDLKWTGSINGNKMSLTFKGAHLPGGRISPFIFVKQRSELQK